MRVQASRVEHKHLPTTKHNIVNRASSSSGIAALTSVYTCGIIAVSERRKTTASTVERQPMRTRHCANSSRAFANPRTGAWGCFCLQPLERSVSHKLVSGAIHALYVRPTQSACQNHAHFYRLLHTTFCMACCQSCIPFQAWPMP